MRLVRLPVGGIQRRNRPRTCSSHFPTIEISRLVNSLKGVSSRYLRRDYPELAQHYWRAQRLWSPSYYAGTAGGAPLATLKQYIEHQNRPA